MSTPTKRRKQAATLNKVEAAPPIVEAAPPKPEPGPSRIGIEWGTPEYKDWTHKMGEVVTGINRARIAMRLQQKIESWIEFTATAAEMEFLTGIFDDACGDWGSYPMSFTCALLDELPRELLADAFPAEEKEWLSWRERMEIEFRAKKATSAA